MEKGYKETKEVRWEKVEALLSDLKEEPFAGNLDQIYCDSNHMFVKVFSDVVMEYFHEKNPNDYQIDVIVLRRYLPMTLRSYMRLEIWDPKFRLNDYTGGEYSLGHRHVAITEPYAPNSEQDTVDLALGYLIDFEAQAQKFKRTYPNIRVVEAHLEEIQEYQGVHKLFYDLDLEMTDKTFKFLNKSAQDKVYNQKFSKSDVKQKTPQPLGIYYSRILEFIEKYKVRNLTLPSIPHLNLLTWCNGYRGIDSHGDLCPTEDQDPKASIPWNVLPKTKLSS